MNKNCCGEHNHHEHAHTEEHCHGHEHRHENCHGHGHGKKKETKVGILLAMFGTTADEASVDYEYLEAQIKERFPNIPVFFSYTADKIRRKLIRQGKEAFSVSQALMDMYDQKFTHIAVQSLHTVPGVEFNWTKQQAESLQHPRKGLQKVSLGAPLITGETLLHVAELIPEYVPTNLKDDEAILLVGHGTYHEAQIYYHALEARVAKYLPNCFVGALMGENLGIDVAIDRMKARNFKKVHLVPFMGVPGHHYLLDLLGEHSTSWKSILEHEGFECQPYAVGTVAHKSFTSIWLHNLHIALAELGEEVSKNLPKIPESELPYIRKEINYGHAHDHYHGHSHGNAHHHHDHDHHEHGCCHNHKH